MSSPMCISQKQGLQTCWRQPGLRVHRDLRSRGPISGCQDGTRRTERAGPRTWKLLGCALRFDLRFFGPPLRLAARFVALPSAMCGLWLCLCSDWLGASADYGLRDLDTGRVWTAWKRFPGPKARAALAAVLALAAPAPAPTAAAPSSTGCCLAGANQPFLSTQLL